VSSLVPFPPNLKIASTELTVDLIGAMNASYRPYEACQDLLDLRNLRDLPFLRDQGHRIRDVAGWTDVIAVFSLIPISDELVKQETRNHLLFVSRNDVRLYIYVRCPHQINFVFRTCTTFERNSIRLEGPPN
jgi:hypothetical protein